MAGLRVAQRRAARPTGSSSGGVTGHRGTATSRSPPAGVVGRRRRPGRGERGVRHRGLLAVRRGGGGVPAGGPSPPPGGARARQPPAAPPPPTPRPPPYPGAPAGPVIL